MGANVAGVMSVDLYALEIPGDESPEAGVVTHVAVSFRFAEPFYSVFLQPAAWPYTIKVYAEGYGDPWPPLGEPGGPYEWWWTMAGTCSQVGNPDYTVNVPISLVSEGVYKLAAIVELDGGAGFVMGFSDEDVQISIWTAP